jgi:class 3 adenylate cyclase
MTETGPGSARVETLTVMFTDLVDSTGMRVRLGEEQAERVRERHDRLVRAAVVANRGRIAKHMGDGVMAVFTGASDALGAAVALQQDLHAENLRGRNTVLLAVRIGISAGDVTVEGEDCFGLPVVEAQRLEAAAQPGQVLVSGLVSALAHGRGGHELRPLGRVELKGLEHPVDAEEVVWHPRPAVSEAPALPPRFADRGAFPFTGRVKEAEALVGAWSTVISGGTRLVLMSGEPGIGKTRLAAETATGIADKGGMVLAGRCDELVGAPYQPFAEALRFRMGQPGGGESLGPAPGELVRLVPELADVVPGLPSPLMASPDAERLRLFEAVRGWVAALAAASPVVLVLDDLHWADAGTLLLMRHIVVTDPVPQLLVLGTYRDTDLDRTHPLSGMLGELRRRAEVTRVVLEGLDTGEVTDLMSRAAGHELGDDGLTLAVEVRAETGGNPFFIGEVLRHLAESGAIVFT